MEVSLFLKIKGERVDEREVRWLGVLEGRRNCGRDEHMVTVDKGCNRRKHGSSLRSTYQLTQVGKAEPSLLISNLAQDSSPGFTSSDQIPSS